MLAVFLVLCASAWSQTAPSLKRFAPSGPTKTVTYEFIRAKLIALSTNDGVNDFAGASFDEASCAVTIKSGTARPSNDAGSFHELDANALSWSVYDPGNKQAKLLRLRMYVRNGGQPVVFSENGKTENNPYLYMVFSLPRVAEVPDFQTQMEKAVKHLITLCGGVPEVTF